MGTHSQFFHEEIPNGLEKRHMNDKRYGNDRSDRNQRQDRPPTRQDAFPDKDEVVAKEEKWKPTDAVFAAFQVRDEQLATFNLRRVLKGSGEMTFRDIKEQCLHSAATVERLLIKFVKDGSVKEGTSKFGPTFLMAAR